jgi:hypothetical protein
MGRVQGVPGPELVLPLLLGLGCEFLCLGLDHWAPELLELPNSTQPGRMRSSSTRRRQPRPWFLQVDSDSI